MIINAASQNTGDRRRVRTAIICPAAIYGFGRGPISKRGGKLTALMRAILLYKSAFQVENGKTHWSVDIDNLAKAYLLLVEKVFCPRGMEDRLWDSEGYYVAETEEVVRMTPKLVFRPADNQVLGYICINHRRTGTEAIVCR